MRQRASWSTGNGRLVAIIAVAAPLGLAAVLAPPGAAQTLPLPSVPLPVEPPSLPSVPLDPVNPAPAPLPAPAPPAPPALSPLPVLPDAPLPSAPTVIPGSITTVADGGGSGAPTVGGLVGAAPISGVGSGPRVATSPTSSAAAASGLSTRQLNAMSPGERRRFFARMWRTPLEGKSLTRLRASALEHWSCRGVLTSLQRRALILRAGLFGHRPATWTVIARRLGVSRPRAVRLTRAGMNRLKRAGMCIEAGGAALGTSVTSMSRKSTVTPRGATVTPTHAENVRSRSGRDAGDVRGAYAESVGLDLGLADDVAGGGRTLLLVLIAAVLAVVGALELASRASFLPPVPLTRGWGRSDKPLLFVDADLARSGESIRVLGSRYEIVWVPDSDELTSWNFRSLPDVDETFQVLRLGREAASVSPAWKLERIAQAAQGLPAALVDETGSLHEAWARERSEPTMLENTDPEAGLAPDQVTRLLEWADAVGPVDPGQSARTGRTERRSAVRPR
jgi:hypothetical protein